MEAINVEAAHRRYLQITNAVIDMEDFIHNKIVSSQWVEYDGEYYRKLEWDAEQAKPTITPEVRDLIRLVHSLTGGGMNSILKKSVDAAFRSLGIEPDAL